MQQKSPDLKPTVSYPRQHACQNTSIVIRILSSMKTSAKL